MLKKLLICSLLLAHLPFPKHAQEPTAERPWTMMIYGAADNDADGPILEFPRFHPHRPG